MNRLTWVLAAAVAAAAFVLGTWVGTQRMIPTSESTQTNNVLSELPFQSGPYRFSMELDPVEPKVGTNSITMVLMDANGNLVENAELQGTAEMLAMGAMPAMRAPLEWVQTEPGIYRGTFTLAMKGGWPLTLNIKSPGLEARTVGFDMATGRVGLQPVAGIETSNSSKTGEQVTGAVSIDAYRRQVIGLTTARIVHQPMTKSIRAVGRVNYDETRRTNVTLKYEAWIGELFADFVGKQVNAGDVLFTVYSPDLYSAQQEYLETLKRSTADRPLLESARQRLKFWDVDDAFITRLERNGKPFKYVEVTAPRSGVVIEKKVVAGSAHMAGATLLKLADLDRVWIEADVYESDLALLEINMPVTTTLSHLPGQTLPGQLEYIYPFMNPTSRTVRVRFSFSNPEGLLKPAMFADVHLNVQLGSRLAVPESAVLLAGQTRVVFQDLGDGRLAPRRVQTGVRGNGLIEILSGIEAGDLVVTSGNFLIASESKLKSALKQW